VVPSSNPNVPVRFGPFELDVRTGELRRDGTSLKLQPQPAKVLQLLVARAGEIVTRQDLAQQVWSSDTFVDFDQGLNYAIRQIRTALDDDAERPRYLETLPKRGYRFIAQIEDVKPKISADLPTGSAEILPSAKAPRGHLRTRLQWIAASAGVVLLAIAAWVYIAGDGSASRGSGRDIQSVAVLPLESLSADTNQDYFADGLTDELITELARLGRFRVISRTSVVGYKGTKKKAAEIGRELNVDAIVEGTVERVGDHARIRAQLIRAGDDQHVWAESYDREVSDLLRLERDVARDIAQQIGYRITEQGDRARTIPQVSAAAHEDYLRGRYYWNKRTEAGLLKGIEYFQKAIDQEPNYALAYAGLADSHIMLANWGFAAPLDAYPKAKTAALKALDLDDELAEAHTSLAYTTLLYDWDWVNAEKRFRKAIAVNPNYASAHHFYSICLMTAGRYKEAVAEIRRAQELDPLSLIVNDVLGWTYYEGRQYDQAIQQFTKTLEMDPNYVPALLDLGSTYLRTGEYGKAVAQFEKARSIAGENGVVLSGLAQAYALSGNQAGAVKIVRQLETPSTASFVSPWDLSTIYVALGDKTRAIDLLQKAANERVGWVVRLGVDPAFDSLQGEPQFQRLIREVGIPKIASQSIGVRREFPRRSG